MKLLRKLCSPKFSNLTTTSLMIFTVYTSDIDKIFSNVIWCLCIFMISDLIALFVMGRLNGTSMLEETESQKHVCVVCKTTTN